MRTAARSERISEPEGLDQLVGAQRKERKAEKLTDRVVLQHGQRAVLARSHEGLVVAGHGHGDEADGDGPGFLLRHGEEEEEEECLMRGRASCPWRMSLDYSYEFELRG